MSVQFEVLEHVAVITLDRPEARNAINGVMSTGIEAALDRYESDASLWAAVLTAKGPVFCAGADLKEIAAGNAGATATAKGGFGGIVHRNRTKPLIAALQGPALAGGCEIALSCDMIVASTEAFFGLPEVKRALIAVAGGLFRLPRAIGMAQAMEVILTGEPLSAERAYQLGLVNRLASPEQVRDEAISLAHKIASNAPLTMRTAKRIVRELLKAPASFDEAACKAFVRECFDSEDYKEGRRAFMEKRAPAFKGR